jgi:DNA-directed RNA polymerase subunit E'/Rpb7
MTTVYTTVFLDERVVVSAAELNYVISVDSITDLLLSKLNDKMEGKCNANGFVRPGSIKLISRSMGIAENGRFTGNIMYDCKIQCDVLYPAANMELDATIIKINKMGAYAQFDEAIRILLPRDLHIGSNEFMELKEGETVRVKLERSRFQSNDRFIMAVGVLSIMELNNVSKTEKINISVAENTTVLPPAPADIQV